MRERSDRFWLVALPLLLLLLFSDILFLGNSLYFRDIFREYYPSRRILHDLIRSGTFPFWNPRYACGQPFAANPGYQVFYPVGLMTLWIPDFNFAFHLEVLIHYFLAAFSMYALLRSCGLRPDSAAFGSISWSIGGLLTALSNLLPFLFAAAWLPLLILFVRRCALRFTRRDFALAAAVMGVIVLNADQAMILQAAAIVVAVAFYCSRSIGRTIVLSAAIGAVALLIGAAAVVPAIGFVRDSGRALPLSRNEVMEWSMLPLRPLELFFPGLFGRYSTDAAFYWAYRFHPPFRHPFVLSIYPGLLVAVLFVCGVIARVRAWGLALLALAGSYLIAIGKFGPVFPLLYALQFRSLRYPEKFFITGVLAVTVLAAFAIDDFARLRRVAVIVTWSVAAAGAAVALFSLLPSYARAFDAVWQLGPAPAAVAQSKEAWFVAAAIAIASAVVLMLHGRLPAPTWAALCVLLLVADLAPRNRGLMPRLPREFATPPPLAQTLPHARIFNRADWQYFSSGAPPVPFSAQPWVLRNALLPRSYASWGLDGAIDLDITHTDLLPMTEFTATFWQVAKSHPERVESMLRMAGVTHVIDALPMNEWSGEDVEHVQPVSVTPLRGSTRYSFAPEGVKGEVRRSVETPNSITLDVRVPARAVLVLAVTADRHWRAAVDGRAVAIVPANIAFQGVPLPPGTHRVELSYRNEIVLICCAISLLSALALALFALPFWHASR